MFTLLVLVLAATCSAQRLTPGPRFGNADWRKCWAKELKEAKTQPSDLLFLGDSLTESWRGTDHCEPCNESVRSTCKGAPAVFRASFGKWRSSIQGIAGDQSANLIWRLQNGVIARNRQPKVAVLLIGTNDFGAAAAGKSGAAASKALAAAVPGTAARVLQAAAYMRKVIPNTHVIVMALLPRGTNSGTFLPVRYNDHRWPSTYTAALRGVNARLRDGTRRDPKLHYLDCGSRFLKGKTIDASLMPDALHPNAAGHRVLAACMRPLIAKMMHQQSRT